MNSTILHLDLDTFFVSVERLKDSRLNGMPIIIGGSSDRAVVSSCSYEARRFGVHSAMPLRIAKRICPQAVFISGDHEAYSQYSSMVTEVIEDESPVFEKASIDEFYVDMTGMERFFGCWKWGTELRQRVTKETGLPISFGMSINKMVAKVATGEAKPSGQLRIEKEEVEDFLAPMPVSKIPMVGPRTTQGLAHMGVRSISILREIPKEVLEHVYGKQGTMLWKRARGIDHAQVVPHSDRKSISTENTFQRDTIDIRFLSSTLVRMTEQLAFKLRDSQKLCACITVKLRYSNFETVSRQARIPYTANDEVLIRKALQLFERLYQKRLLVRLIGVKLSHMVYGSHQIVLFEDTEKKIDLFQAMDTIKHKYGGSSIRRASGLVEGEQRPGS